MGILDLLHRQHAVEHRHPGVQRHPHQALCAQVGHVLVVAGVAADHAAEHDQRVVAAALGQLARGHWQLPGAGQAHHVDRRLRHAIVGQALPRTGHQGVGDARVPAAGQDREAGAFGQAQVAFVQGHGRKDD